jgi:hypothetical protein
MVETPSWKKLVEVDRPEADIEFVPVLVEDGERERILARRLVEIGDVLHVHVHVPKVKELDGIEFFVQFAEENSTFSASFVVNFVQDRFEDVLVHGLDPLLN